MLAFSKNSWRIFLLYIYFVCLPMKYISALLIKITICVCSCRDIGRSAVSFHHLGGNSSFGLPGSGASHQQWLHHWRHHHAHYLRLCSVGQYYVSGMHRNAFKLNSHIIIFTGAAGQSGIYHFSDLWTISTPFLKSMALTLHQSGHGHSHGGLGSKAHGHSHEKTESSNQISNGVVDPEQNRHNKGIVLS